MKKTTTAAALTLAAVAALAPAGGAYAQFSPFVTLPGNDFTWRWGDLERASRGIEDISINGTESGFRCDLTAKLSPSSRRTPNEIREIESELRTSLYFIQAAANAMNVLDRQLELDWAELACIKHQDAEPDPEKSQERVDRAREKAVQEMLERRERRERREARGL